VTIANPSTTSTSAVTAFFNNGLIAPATAANSTTYWDGTDWVENPSIRSHLVSSNRARLKIDNTTDGTGIDAPFIVNNLSSSALSITHNNVQVTDDTGASVTTLNLNFSGGDGEIGGQTAASQVKLMGSGSAVQNARTVAVGSGGFEVNNQSTGAGLERVLTTSDGALYLPLAGGTMTGQIQGYAGGTVNSGSLNTTGATTAVRAQSYSTMGSAYSSAATFLANNAYVDNADAVSGQFRHAETHATYGHTIYEQAAGAHEWFGNNDSVTEDAIVTKVSRMTLSAAGNLAVTGTVTGSNLNISNWDTAFGWGDHDGLYSLAAHTHLLAAGATDVTATAAEVNLLDLAGLTAGWVLSADTATTASWKAQAAASLTPWSSDIDGAGFGLDNIDRLEIQASGVATDTAIFTHDGTDFNTDFSNTTNWNVAAINSLRLETAGSAIELSEAANDSGTSTAGYGKYWVKNGTPNHPWFTDDSGIETNLHSGITEVVEKTATYELVIGDRGRTIWFTGATASKVCTIPADASVAFPIGSMVGIENDGSVNMTIAITTDTLTWSKDNTTGTRTLAPGASCVIKKVAATSWKISGSALVT
jgi:hypothetical protein